MTQPRYVLEKFIKPHYKTSGSNKLTRKFYVRFCWQWHDKSVPFGLTQEILFYQPNKFVYVFLEMRQPSTSVSPRDHVISAWQAITRVRQRHPWPRGWKVILAPKCLQRSFPCLCMLWYDHWLSLFPAF